MSECAYAAAMVFGNVTFDDLKDKTSKLGYCLEALSLYNHLSPAIDKDSDGATVCLSFLCDHMMQKFAKEYRTLVSDDTEEEKKAFIHEHITAEGIPNLMMLLHRYHL